MTTLEKYENWCNSEYFDGETKKELRALEGNPSEIEERFYKELAFGTGGLRGIIGAGTNRMNIYTVRKATQGLANFIKKEEGADKGVAIAFDSRRMSPEFAREAACCLCANGIQVYIFDSLRPTPELSFAVRELGCIAGIVITASHNPPEYNGYKVYWEDGAQITYPKDVEIISQVNAIASYDEVKTMEQEEAAAAGLYHVIGEEIDKKYIEALKALVLNPDVVKKQADHLKIVYTPLHGTGNLPVRRILQELGFHKVYVVPEQELPDGDFPTVSYPNPEDPKAFTLALELAKKVDADIILATDPDADRLGVYAKDNKTGEYMPFTGNMSGMLICEYQLQQKKEKGILPENGAIVTTIVSGKMSHAMASEYNVHLIETLTGFKYIGEQIKLFERTRNRTYLFGYEESYGCLLGTHARDKDAVVAVMALCEAAAYYKKKGLTLWEQMVNLFEKYGYYKELLYTVTLSGIQGAEKIKEIMKNIRKCTVNSIGGYKLLAFKDYENDCVLNCLNGKVYPTGLPKSDVLYFKLENDTWFCVRPSGTEPKIKLYIGVKGTSLEDAEEKANSFKAEVIKLMEQ